MLDDNVWFQKFHVQMFKALTLPSRPDSFTLHFKLHYLLLDFLILYVKWLNAFSI